MPQDHPAPVPGERGAHRRINGCRRPPDFRFTLCCPCVPSGTRCPSPRVLLRSRDSPPPPGGGFFCDVAARDRNSSTKRTFCAAVGPLRCHIVPALCQKPPSCVISRKMPVFGNTAFFAPLQNPGFQRGFLAFWLSNAVFPPGNGGRLQFYDPDAAFRATRPARWFNGVPPGGFAVFDGEMLSKRCFSSALFPIPNYFYEIVAKIVRVVIK